MDNRSDKDIDFSTNSAKSESLPTQFDDNGWCSASGRNHSSVVAIGWGLANSVMSGSPRCKLHLRMMMALRRKEEV